MPLNRVSVVRSGLVRSLETSEQLDDAVGRVRTVAQHLVSPAPLRRSLSGTDLGHPIHPVLVQLPLGLWISTWILDVIGLGRTRAARRLLGFGVLGSLLGLGRHRRSRGTSRAGPRHHQLPCCGMFDRVLVEATRRSTRWGSLVDARSHSRRCGRFSRRPPRLRSGGRRGYECFRRRSSGLDGRAWQRADRESRRSHRRRREDYGGPGRFRSIRTRRLLQPPRRTTLGGDVRGSLRHVPVAWQPIRPSERRTYEGSSVHTSGGLRDPTRAGKLELRRRESRALRRRPV